MPIGSLGEPQDRFQRQPECISRLRTSAGARYRENRRLVGPAHKQAIQWNCQTTDSEKKVAEDTLPSSADGGLSGPARIASSAPRLLECRPGQRLVYVPFPHACLYANQVRELRLTPAQRQVSKSAIFCRGEIAEHQHLRREVDFHRQEPARKEKTGPADLFASGVRLARHVHRSDFRNCWHVNCFGDSSGCVCRFFNSGGRWFAKKLNLLVKRLE